MGRLSIQMPSKQNRNSHYKDIKGSRPFHLYIELSVWGRRSLTHWGRVTHICVSNLTIIGSDNGLSPGRRQAIIWTNAGILSIGTLGTNFSEILIEILRFSFKNMRLKVPSGKWRPFCLGPNVLIKLKREPGSHHTHYNPCLCSVIVDNQSGSELERPVHGVILVHGSASLNMNRVLDLGARMSLRENGLDMSVPQSHP